MGYLSEMIENSQNKKSKFQTLCLRCESEIYSISSDNKKYLSGWLCLDCSAIMRRGGVVVKEIDADQSPEQIINNLVLACESALLLRGLWSAINDPLALEGDKQKYRLRFLEIEEQIKKAIITAASNE